MNSIKKIKITITTIFILSFSIFIGQNTNEEETLILGTWVAEGSSADNKWVFKNNQILEKHTNNSLGATFSWSIISSVNSGVTSHYLETVNTNDSTDRYNYEISIVNNERLVLIYQRKNNMGLSKPSLYIKQ